MFEYKDITSKGELLNALSNNMYEQIGVYFICEDCDDEQMTIVNVTEETVSQVEDTNSIFVGISCTNDYCNRRIKFLKVDYVTGIEQTDLE